MFGPYVLNARAALVGRCLFCVVRDIRSWQAWQRPTLPGLET